MRVRHSLIAIMAVAGIVAVYYLFRMMEYGGWVNSLIDLAIALIVTAASFVLIYFEKEKINKEWLLFIVYVVAAIIMGLKVATPNMLSNAYNLHHASAVVDSIYNVLHGVQFSGDQTDQYGHYSLFFYLPLKLFGESMLTLSAIMGAIYAASFFCLCGAIHITLRSNYMKVLTAIAAALFVTTLTANSIYWQNLPLRAVFPFIMIFVVAFYAKRKDPLTKKEYAIGSIISILAILWNFESGVAVSAAWFMYLIINYYQKNDFNAKSLIKNMSIIVAAMIFYILVPFITVNLYNWLVTGFDTNSLLSIKEFVGSMTDSEYFGRLNTKWIWYTQTNITSIFMMFLFLGCIAWALRSTSMLSKKGSPSALPILAATVSITGLVLLTQCINRAVSVPGHVWIYAAVALGIIASGMVSEIRSIKGWKKFELYGLLKVSICSLALIGLALMGTAGMDLKDSFEDKHATGAYDNRAFVSFAEKVGAKVPKDTLAVGEGTSAIYLELGWDKHYYKFYSTEVELKDCFSSNDSFFIKKSLSTHVDTIKYGLAWDIVYKGTTYEYYVRK
ncbi:MAG: hypothetical protein LBV13_06350 [Methanomassiliicoccaceae archaeon]|nr:hypothetical protein [Methanomassiliicoccaceae archaeon]